MKRAIFVLSISAIGLISCDKELETDSNTGSELTINGRLSEYINENNIYNISKLIINGSICGEDWNTLWEMGAIGNLSELDMTNAIIEDDKENDFWNANEIPEVAFCDCKQLSTVKLPKSVKIIGSKAFLGCSRLKHLVLPMCIDSIGDEAFRKVPLEGILNLPPSTRTIGKQAFAYSDIEEVIINSDIESPFYKNASTIGGNSVFAGCKKLTKVIVSEGCKKLEMGFDGCNSLYDVSLPSTLETIGYNSRHTHNYIFAYCSSLTHISIPKNVWLIGDSAFGHSGLASIILPDAVQYLCDNAFANCIELKELKMPKQLRQIGHRCCIGCVNLREIQIPDNVSIINSQAFRDCASLNVGYWGRNISSIDCSTLNVPSISLSNVPGVSE